jgi:hypothetical protein
MSNLTIAILSPLILATVGLLVWFLITKKNIRAKKVKMAQNAFTKSTDLDTLKETVREIEESLQQGGPTFGSPGLAGHPGTPGPASSYGFPAKQVTYRELHQVFYGTLGEVCTDRFKNRVKVDIDVSTLLERLSHPQKYNGVKHSPKTHIHLLSVEVPVGVAGGHLLATEELSKQYKALCMNKGVIGVVPNHDGEAVWLSRGSTITVNIFILSKYSLKETIKAKSKHNG